MKKFAWMIAALSLCACSFVACSDDDDKKDDKPTVAKLGDACSDTIKCDTGLKCDNKKCVKDEAADGTKGGKCRVIEEGADGLPCDANLECKENICVEASSDIADGAEGGKCRVIEEGADGLPCDANLECKENICVKATSDEKKDDGAACTKDEDCKSNSCSGEEGSKVCIPAGEDCTAFAPSCETTAEGMIAYTACSADTGITKVECFKNTDGKTDCKDGACVEPAGDVECSKDSDCKDKDASKPYCNSGVCGATQEVVDPCTKVNCLEGLCDRGICVTDDMKKLAAGDPCVDSDFQTFCNGEKLVQCSKNKIVMDDCATDKIGKCTVAENLGKYEALCSGDETAIKLCKANEALATPETYIETCYGTQDWVAKVICVLDVNNEYAINVIDMAKDCEGKACKYDNDKAVCSE